MLPNNFKVGVTGTRHGMTDAQRKNVFDWLSTRFGMVELHHGDCIGVDVQVACIAENIYNTPRKIVCHPPVDSKHRAFHESDEIKEEFTHFARNRNIVNSVDILLVVPFQNEWHSKGGTWYTHDYAKKQHKKIIIFYPDGRIVG